MEAACILASNFHQMVVKYSNSSILLLARYQPVTSDRYLRPCYILKWGDEHSLTELNPNLTQNKYFALLSWSPDWHLKLKEWWIQLWPGAYEDFLHSVPDEKKKRCS